MTFADRVTALAPLCLSQRQAAFVVTVVLHSGFCLRRQYGAFTGATHGKTTRDFLDGLVRRRLARQMRYAANRGSIYHLHSRTIYRLIGRQDDRNSRHVSPLLIARKLMLLDLAISLPDAQWFVTEEEKVELFTKRFGVPVAALPFRACRPRRPVFLGNDPSEPVTLVCPIASPDASELRLFLLEHAALLNALPAARVLVVGPRDIANDAICHAVFATAWRAKAPVPLTGEEAAWLDEKQRLLDAGRVCELSVEDLRRIRDLRQRPVMQLSRSAPEGTCGDSTPSLATVWFPS